jgi:enamine deaminase RidA (YjgF/YER057c/UK114 family)
VVTRHGDTIYVSGLPPFDPETGEVVDAPIERQTEPVMEQLKLCVETAGSSLRQRQYTYDTSRRIRPPVSLSASRHGLGVFISKSTA